MSIRWDCKIDGCYKDNCIPDWGFLQGLLPRGCRPTDVDGIVELDGRFLVLEWKTHEADISWAQETLFKRLTSVSTDIEVVVVYSDTISTDSVSAIRTIFNGHAGEKRACTVDQFKKLYQSWGAIKAEEVTV